ncbi:hypothetical protein SBRCBS47491_005650 [Sporothrix bragantina]|uniref:Uncharacterized protein n=1 Tax=Sporothrix bragantina TaxID=671064 RepID=A0ABP0BZA0_9PEZI
MTGGRNPDIANYEPPDSSEGEDDEAEDDDGPHRQLYISHGNKNVPGVTTMNGINDRDKITTDKRRANTCASYWRQQALGKSNSTPTLSIRPDV